ncbi:MAG: GntR family transcriptional regulator [Firmicutes bacterium]|nr:GntR family transcriptional regulator [Bacillota bacterium]
MPLIELPDQKLDESSPTPLYYQLRELIADTIKGGQYGPEYKLPSERELAEKYGLSRMTVRQATIALVNDGFLVRKRGMGTFVSPPKVEQGLLKLTGFTEDMRQRGMVPSTRILAMKQEQASENTARKLGIAEGEGIILLERLRLADGEPMAYERCHLPQGRFPELTEDDLKGQSLYALLTTKYNISFESAKQSLEATVATKREAAMLNVTRGAPLLLLERSTLDQNGRVIEFVKSLYRADRYKFHVHLLR